MALENLLKTMKLEYFIEDPNLKSFRCAYGTSAGIDIFTKEEQIIPSPTPTKPKNFDKYNSFTALKDGYYCIYLKQNEEIYYPKQKDSK